MYEYKIVDVHYIETKDEKVEAAINVHAKLGFRVVFVSEHLVYMEREVEDSDEKSTPHCQPLSRIERKGKFE